MKPVWELEGGLEEPKARTGLLLNRVACAFLRPSTCSAVATLKFFCVCFAPGLANHVASPAQSSRNIFQCSVLIANVIFSQLPGCWDSRRSRIDLQSLRPNSISWERASRWPSLENLSIWMRSHGTNLAARPAPRMGVGSVSSQEKRRSLQSGQGTGGSKWRSACAVSLEEINKMFLAAFHPPWINTSPWRGLKYHPWSAIPLGWAHETWNVPAGRTQSPRGKLTLMSAEC